VVLDTGSSDFWVANSTCLTGGACGSSSAGFNQFSSSSFQGSSQVLTIRYGSGQVAGIKVTDTVSIGGFKVSQQGWLLANQASANLITGSDAGIMGLAFPAISVTGATPFWQSLISGNQLSSPEMAFWLKRDPTATTEVSGGTVTFGGTNPSLFKGNIDFQNVISSGGTDTFWLLQVNCKSYRQKLCIRHNMSSSGRRPRK
jgi:cathepsin D